MAMNMRAHMARKAPHGAAGVTRSSALDRVIPATSRFAPLHRARARSAHTVSSAQPGCPGAGATAVGQEPSEWPRHNLRAKAVCPKSIKAPVRLGRLSVVIRVSPHIEKQQVCEPATY